MLFHTDSGSLHATNHPLTWHDVSHTHTHTQGPTIVIAVTQTEVLLVYWIASELIHGQTVTYRTGYSSTMNKFFKHLLSLDDFRAKPSICSRLLSRISLLDRSYNTHCHVFLKELITLNKVIWQRIFGKQCCSSTLPGQRSASCIVNREFWVKFGCE